MTTMLSDEQVQILKQVLQETCTDEKTVPRSEIFDKFEKLAKSKIEKYRFERDLSELIRSARITGYEVKVGRNGGVIRTEPIERVEITCSEGKYIGTMPSSKLAQLISYLKR